MPPHVGVVAKSAEGSAKAKTGTWESTFPGDIEKPSESAIFMTRLLYVSFSHILQSRRLAPATAFRKRAIDGCVRSYVPNLRDDVGMRLSTKLRGASLAIEKGFLDELIIVVNPAADNDEKAIEVFKWKMHYHENGDCSASILDNSDSERLSVRYSGLESAKKKTIGMLQTVRYLCCELLSPLPQSASADLMITYTGAAPKGYQADGFHRCPTMYTLDEHARSVNLSVIPAPHHTGVLTVESVYVEDEYAIEAKLDDRNNTNMSLNSTMDESFNGGNMNVSMEQPIFNRVPEVAASKPRVAPPADPHMPRSKSKRTKNQPKTATPERNFSPDLVGDIDDQSQLKKPRKSTVSSQARRTPGTTKQIKMADSPHMT